MEAPILDVFINSLLERGIETPMISTVRVASLWALALPH